MKAFAIIRHQKIKAGRHLVATGLHNARGIETPNADKSAPPVEIMVGTNKPWRDVTNTMDRLGIAKVRKNGNVAVEVFLGASPEWWASQGWRPGVMPMGETLAVIQAWKAEQLAYLEARFGKHLIASVVLHQDEASPHVHALIVPAQFRRDGREKGPDAGRAAWRLSTEKVLPGPSAMKSIVTAYANRMSDFGLVRGQNRPAGTTQHKPLKQWQEEQAALSERLGSEFMRQIGMTQQAALDAERIRREAHAYAARVKALADKEAKEARDLIVIRDEALRRKEDASSAARLQLEVDREQLKALHLAAACERDALQKLRERLDSIMRKLELLVEPIVSYAARYRDSAPIIRQAMGAKGPAAAKIAGSNEVAELETLRRLMGGRGAGR
jgi:hypothetical protein